MKSLSCGVTKQRSTLVASEQAAVAGIGDPGREARSIPATTRCKRKGRDRRSRLQRESERRCLLHRRDVSGSA
jgi:hypothetical protein